MGNCIFHHYNLRYQNNTTPLFSFKGRCMYGKVVDVIDGRNVDIVFYIDKTFIRFSCRLKGIHVTDMIGAKEYIMKQLTGCSSTSNISHRCAQSTKLMWVKCHSFDKQNRLHVTLYSSEYSIVSLNDLMVENGHAYRLI